MKTETQYCVNKRTGEVFAYTIHRDYSTTFPPAVLTNYLDSFVSGFKTEREAKEWSKGFRSQVPDIRQSKERV